MSRSVSLFKELNEGGYDACLMTSFSIDFPFYEDVLLRRMQSAGINHHMLFVDKNMCLAAMQEREPCKVGSQYVLAPMECKGAFHPKVIMLLGKHKGLLAVGSHNVTLSGFGQNLEVTNILRYSKGNEENRSIFHTAFGAYKDWLTSYGQNLPSTVSEALERTLSLSPWLKGTAEKAININFLYSSPTADSLWQQLQSFLPSEIERVTGVSAFFDRNLDFVNELTRICAEAPVIAVQPETVSAPQSLVSHADVHLIDINSVSALDNNKNYVHCKALLFEGENKLLVSGSANLSRPAWLDVGDNGNAEAVLLVSGDTVEPAALALSLEDIAKGLPTKSIVDKPIKTLPASITRIEMLLVDDKGAEHILIPVDEAWPEGHILTYKNMLGVSSRIGAVVHNGFWQISREESRSGEVISIESDGVVYARVIVLDMVQIRKNSSVGRERQLQQALASLNTNTPEINFLFGYFSKILSAEACKNNTVGEKSSEYKPDESEPDSLIEELNVDQLRKAQSGRARCSTGDIAEFLDVIIYSLGSGSRTDSNKAFGEDALGRTEEDLIDTEDGEETADETPIFAKELEKEIAKAFQKKLKTILKRLDGLVSKTACLDEGYLKQVVPPVLGVLILTHELYQAQKDNHWVTEDYLRKLSEIIYSKLFSEKFPTLVSDASIGEDSVFKSDEWAKLLGYVAWLSFHADICLKNRLPLSALLEEKSQLRWENASWLFLAQRLIGDKHADKIAAKLLAEEGNIAASWYKVLIQVGKEIVSNRSLPFEAGFKLASSPYGAFKGYRIITYEEGHDIWMASISDLKSKKYSANKLEVFEIKIA